MRQEKIRTIHYGIGAVGAEVVRLALDRLDVEIVGAIDAYPAKAGKDLGEAVGLARSLGISVTYDADLVLKDSFADVVIHATGSSLTTVYPQILQIVSSEKSVVSSCEELSFPWARYPDIAQKLDRRAREVGVRILGTGVNPGFVMDSLPLLLATASQQVKSVRATRVVDVGMRRMQLQTKVGVGLSVQGFKQGANNGTVGHVGLMESAFMIADTLGWRLDDLSETIEPVIAREKMETEYRRVDKGYVAGLRQTVSGRAADREVIYLELQMSLSAPNPRDEITIDGRPPIKIVIPAGVQGDPATAAIMVNCLPAIANSRSVGLLSMRDMNLVPYLRPRPRVREELTG
ncbi:MAG: dihydrodipicolinate reductase [Dehalococcoidia bacterium]